jgi:hypothetical protein
MIAGLHNSAQQENIQYAGHEVTDLDSNLRIVL